MIITKNIFDDNSYEETSFAVGICIGKNLILIKIGEIEHEILINKEETRELIDLLEEEIEHL